MKLTLSKKLYGLTGGLLGILLLTVLIASLSLTYLGRQYDALTGRSAEKLHPV